MYGSSLRLGRIAGIEIAINYSLFLIGVFVVIQMNMILETQLPTSKPATNIVIGIFSAFIFFASILWHELAHAIVAKLYNVRVKRILLFFLGGVAEIQDEPRKPAEEFWIAIVGPISSAILGGLFFLIYTLLPELSPMGIAFRWLGLINFLLAGFNMLPGFPLDGARVLRAILWWLTGNHLRATRIVSYFGIGVAGVLLVLGMLSLFVNNPAFGGPLINLFMAWFLYSASKAHLRDSQFRDKMRGTPIGKLVQGSIPLKAEWPLAYAADIIAMGKPDSALPVMRSGRLVGVLSLDLLQALPRIGWSGVRVQDIMQNIENIRTVDAHVDVYDALRNQDLNQERYLLVMNQQIPLGLVSQREIVTYAENRARY